MAYRSRLDADEIGFLSKQIAKIAKQVENREYKRHLSETVEVLQNLKLRSKYRWFSLESEYNIDDTNDRPNKKIPVELDTKIDEDFLPIWCEIWPTNRFLLDMLCLTFYTSGDESVINIRNNKDIGLYRIVEKYAVILDNMYYSTVRHEDLHEDLVEIFYNLLNEVQDYVMGGKIKYNSRRVRFDKRYYSWVRNWLNKLASFWLGLSSSFTPLLAKDLQQLDNTGGPLDKAIVQREDLLQRRQRLGPRILAKMNRYTTDLVNMYNNARYIYVNGRQSMLMEIDDQSLLKKEIKSLVSYIDTVVASKEINDLMFSPAFIIYLNSQLNQMRNDVRYKAKVEGIINQDALLRSLAEGPNDQYTSYKLNLTKYVNNGQLEIVVNDEAINIHVYSSTGRDLLYTIQLSVSRISSYGLEIIEINDQQYRYFNNVVYLSKDNQVIKVPTFNAYQSLSPKYKYIENVGLVLNYKDLGLKSMPQAQYGRLVYVFFEATIVPGS